MRSADEEHNMEEYMADNMKGIVKAVCTSPAKGTEKKPVAEAFFIVGHGIEGDAHAGKWHRQVSLLSYDKVEAFNALGAQVEDGAFGENLLVEGIDFKSLPVGSIFRCGTVVLKMTQIGKECHTSCAIRNRVGDCIMPREGVFAEVLAEGVIRPVETMIIPDEPLILKKELIRLADQRSVDLVITSGGTGFSMRDRTPEATMEVADRNAPGIAEYIRMRSMQITDRAMLSRGASVIRKGTLIVNLPGSPKAVRESLSFILHSLDHGLKILRGSATECARK